MREWPEHRVQAFAWDGCTISPPKENNTTRLLRRIEAISTELGPSRRAKTTDSQYRPLLLIWGTEAIISPRCKACGATSAHPRDHLTTLVACSDHAVVLICRPTLGAGVANLLHGLPLIVGRAEAVIAPTHKALWTDSAYFHKGATGIATLGGKAVAAGGHIARGATAVVGQRSYGLLGLGGMERDEASSHQHSQRPQWLRADGRALMREWVEHGGGGDWKKGRGSHTGLAEEPISGNPEKAGTADQDSFPCQSRGKGALSRGY